MIAGSMMRIDAVVWASERSWPGATFVTAWKSFLVRPSMPYAFFVASMLRW
jgi:hypothetical protein